MVHGYNESIIIKGFNKKAACAVFLSRVQDKNENNLEDLDRNYQQVEDSSAVHVKGRGYLVREGHSEEFKIVSTFTLTQVGAYRSVLESAKYRVDETGSDYQTFSFDDQVITDSVFYFRFH